MTADSHASTTQRILGRFNAQASDNSTAIVAIIERAYELATPRPVNDAELEAARQRIEALPVDRLPEPEAMPVGSRMDVGRNALFVGRQNELRILATVLKGSRSAHSWSQHIAVVTGIGGIGKTQLASEFVHRYGQYFAGGVFWLSFSDPSAVPTAIAACGEPQFLNLWPPSADVPLEVKVGLVLAAWQSPLPRLLVFDRCEEAALLSWRPRSGGSQVLVTNRSAAWDPTLGVQPVPLDVFSRADSVTLLGKHRPDLAVNDANLDAIANELGDLPLALHLAGTYLDRYRHAVTPAAYLAQLRSPAVLDHPSLHPRGVKPIGQEEGVARTFAVSYDRLESSAATDALALALLARAAHYAPDQPIPRDLLLAALPLPSEDLDAPLRAEDAVARLLGLGLLEEESATTGALSLHRLLSLFVQRTMTADAVAQARAAIEEALLNRFSELKPIESAGGAVQLTLLLPHLRAVAQASSSREDERAASLCSVLGHVLHEVIGDYAAARPYLERALAIRERVLGEDHADTATSLDYLGVLLTDKADYAAARPYLERALAIRERLQPTDGAAIATSLNHWGWLLYEEGRLAEARPCFERALTLRDQVLGANDLALTESLTNLGWVLREQGEFAAARPHLERALAIRREVLGEDHRDTAESLNNLGFLLLNARRYDEARPYLERALAVRREVLGNSHPDTVISLNDLGVLLRDQGRYSDARPYFEEALAIRERVLGENHIDTATTLNNLGFLLTLQDQYAAARPYFERALAVRRCLLGEDHAYTATSLNDLGTVLLLEGRLADARPYLERALAVREAVLPPMHPYLAVSLHKMGSLLRKEGHPADARPYLERALTIRQQALTNEDPDTADTLSELAAVLRAEGDEAGAKDYYTAALEILKAGSGPDHPLRRILVAELTGMDVVPARGDAPDRTS